MGTMLYLRNRITGEIRDLEAFCEEHVGIRFERDPETNHFVWEETSSADAHPEQFAHPHEVAARARWGVADLSMVKADGTPTSKAAEKVLTKLDPGNVPVAVVERDKLPEPETGRPAANPGPTPEPAIEV